MTRNSRSPAREFSELKDTGLLWLINRVVFHPRGYALALYSENGKAVGWKLLGDGTEVWDMGSDPTPEEREKYGALSEDELFTLVKKILP